MSAPADALRPGVGAAALAVVLAGSTLGEGGATANATIAIHGALIACCIATLIAGRSLRIPARPFGTALAAFVALALVASLRAAYGYAAFLSLQELGAFLAVLVAASTVGRDLPRRLAPALLGTAAAHAAWAIGQRWIAGVERPSGTFLNPNHLGAWLVAATLVAWGTPRPSRAGQVARAALSMVTAAGLAVTASRGAALGAVVGGAVLAGCSWRRLAPARRRAALAVAAVGLVVVVAVLATRARESDAFAFHRVGIWRAALATGTDRPLLGVGPGQFPWEGRAHWFDDGEPPMRFDRRFDNTHSDWLRPAVETGFAGALALLTAVALAATGAVRRARRDDLVPGEAGALAALAALLAQAGVENLSDRPALVLLAAALLGACVADGGRWIPPGGRAVRAVGIAALGGAFVLGDVATWLAWRAERAASEASEPSARLERLEEAIRRNPVKPYPYARLADTLATSGALEPARYARAREAAESAVRLHPRDSELHRSLARLEATACLGPFRERATLGRALAAYAEAEALAPYDATLPFEVGDLLWRLGMAREASRQAQRAVALEPDAVAPALLVAEIALDPAVGLDAREAFDRALALAARSATGSWDNAYTRTLMRTDPTRVERIRAALATAAAPVED